MSLPDVRDRIRGGVLGTLVGDALGVPVEFLDRSALDANPVIGMRGGGTWNQPAGTWSDDGAMTLVCADMLASHGWDPAELMQGFHRWLYGCSWTARGSVFDVGRTTAQAIDQFARERDSTSCGQQGESANGNGSLMRCLPVSAWVAGRPVADSSAVPGEASALTHAHIRSRLCCMWHAGWCRAAMSRSDPGDCAAVASERLRSAVPDSERPHLARILDGTAMRLPRKQVPSDGYVVSTLEASLWCLAHGRTFEEIVLSAVNLGGDADTTGAVTGGMAGWLLGASTIPEAWIEALPRRAEVEALIEGFTERCLAHWSGDGSR